MPNVPKPKGPRNKPPFHWTDVAANLKSLFKETKVENIRNRRLQIWLDVLPPDLKEKTERYYKLLSKQDPPNVT